MIASIDPSQPSKQEPPPMDPAIAEALLQLNRAFYDRFALEYAQSRSPCQPGLQKLLAFLPRQGRLLDVGCGHGRLAHLLDQQGYGVAYTGVDSSPALLAIARADAAPLTTSTDFVEADITQPGWREQLTLQHYDAIVAIAVLHHIPGWQRRRHLLAQLAGLLDTNGMLALSTWQFLNEARLRRKIVDWSAAGLTAAQVEPGDYLLDWQRGGVGLRYCHLVEEAELKTLAAEVGLELHAIYQEDGRGSNLNLFAIFVPGR